MIQFYPQREERMGGGPGGRFYLAELTEILPALLGEFAGKVQLIYIDPPFASGADYAKKVYIRRNPRVAEAIAKAEEELDIEIDSEAAADIVTVGDAVEAIKMVKKNKNDKKPL